MDAVKAGCTAAVVAGDEVNTLGAVTTRMRLTVVNVHVAAFACFNKQPPRSTLLLLTAKFIALASQKLDARLSQTHKTQRSPSFESLVSVSSALYDR